MQWLSMLLLCLSCASHLAAQDGADARNILDCMVASFAKSGGVEMAFTTTSPEGETEGVIRLKGEKFMLETDEALTWFDGRTQWSYLLSSDEVNVSEPTPEELQSIHPYSWFSMYKQGYALKLESADATSYGITMTAMDKMSTLQRVTLYVDRTTEQPCRLSLLMQGSSEPTEIVVRKYRSDCSYPDSFFVFDKKKYPTAEVIDLR